MEFYSAIELGLIYSLVALGIYFTFRIANFPDLTVDGSFPLGAAVSAVLLTKGLSPVLATLLAMIAGMMAGAITSFLHLRLRILGLLASILTMSALYSINIRIMGSPNIALLDTTTLFSAHAVLPVMCGIVLMAVFFIILFFKTQYGLALRAAGANSTMASAFSISPAAMTSLALMLSNGLVALAGACFAQSQGFADVSLGTGTLVTGLASIIIGEAIIRTKHISFAILSCVLGAMVYRAAITFSLNLGFFGLQASDINLLTSIIIVIMLAITGKLR